MKKILLPLIILFMALHLAFEYFTTGVATHHLLADEDLPGISNWWGLLLVPLAAWGIITLIENQDQKRDHTTSPSLFLRRLGIGFAFGLSITLLWTFNQEAWLSYWILLPVALSVIWKTYRGEYYLGLVLGMVFAFGGTLPLIVGGVLAALSFIVHHTLGRIWRYLGLPN